MGLKLINASATTNFSRLVHHNVLAQASNERQEHVLKAVRPNEVAPRSKAGGIQASLVHFQKETLRASRLCKSVRTNEQTWCHVSSWNLQ